MVHNQSFSQVILLLQAGLLTAHSADMGDCRYRFTEQPSDSITCNPYPTGRLVLRCAVEFFSTEGSPLNLAWYSRAQTENISQQVQAGFLTRNYTTSRVETELTIHLLSKTDNGLEESPQNSKTYFCRVTLANGTVLSDSQEIQLFSQPITVINAPKPCDKQEVHSTHIQKCIDPLSGSEPLPTTAQSLPTQTIEVSESVEDDVEYDWTSVFGDQFLLYCAIGAVVLLIIIVLFFLLCLCVCNRLCKQSGYCTCCV